MVDQTDVTSPRSHDCTECAAPVAHVPGTRILQCTRWENHQREIVAIPRQIRGHRYEDRANEPIEPADDAIHRYTCSGCGAYSQSDTPSRTCQLCAAPLAAATAALAQLEPDAVVPFELDRAAAGDALRTWLASLRFAPSRLKEVTRAESMKSTYLPYWAFHAKTRSDYTGQRGEYYWTTQTYTTTDSRGNTTTHTNTVRNTAWHGTKGSVKRSFANVLVAATRRLDEKQLTKVGPWSLRAAVPYQPEFLYGHHRLPYEIKLDAGLSLAKAQMAKVITKDCEGDIGGDDQQVDSVRTNYADVTYQLLLFPAWIGSYRYGDKSWQIFINGCTGTVHGDRPYSAIKIMSTIVAALAAVAAVVALIVLANQT